MEKYCFKNQRGQTLLIVVLVMVVVLTMGLAVASRSIIGMRTSTEQSESQKALSAAEAGIEQALTETVISSEDPISGTLDNNATFKRTASLVKGASFNLNGGNIVAKDEGFDVWLSDYSTESSLIYSNPWSGKLIIRWGEDSSDACKNAALEIVVLSGEKDNPTLTKYAVDPCGKRAEANSFTSKELASVVEKNGKTYYYASSITINNGFLARIIPLYYSSSIGVEGGTGTLPLPPQGSVIESTGTVNETTRKVTVFRGYPRLPSELFQYSLFTPNNNL